MQNSRWQMNRIGLIDFWYYDEEEFYFLDGRMLLRGANGSGKSVTMQSFIPLLLDGNMRPERLDPFGSRARKMENYLLEEGDAREERTGYLYMEFKRQESGTYLTIGIGLRARKNKKLDTWYFYINDGRRMGQDFFLYKDVDHKIAYTKQELKNRIGEGGRVIESQSEYMEAVNRLVFGFDTIGQYKEMLELLIQLRTPKLSKEFKPTVINDILSSSLQTLSEDDLRPMSEAIENMDSLKTNLDSLRDSLRAAGQIQRVYQSYNQVVLYQKAGYFLKAAAESTACEAASRKLEEETEQSRKEAAEEELRYQELLQEEKLCREERDSLSASDAARLKEQELELERQKQEEGAQIDKKKAQESEKDERLKEKLGQKRRQDGENEDRQGRIHRSLEEMEEELGELPFDEFTFLKSDLEERMEEPYDFTAHQQLLGAYAQKVEAGVQALIKEKQEQEQYDGQLSQVDGLRRERDSMERDVVQYRNQLQEVRGELVEALYRWEQENQELHLAREQMQALSRRVEDFGEDSDYSDIRELARQEKNQREDGLREQAATVQAGLREAQRALEEKCAELREWEEKKEPEPEQPPKVRRNRERLQELGIPYQQFYRTVDFDSRLTPEQAGRLEEALDSMGILDALIVPAEYREQVLKLDGGVCDRYLFGDAAYVKQSLTELLDVDNPEEDIFYQQKVSNVLRSIGYTASDKGPSTWIGEDGNYRIGILEGTVAGEFESRYIGAKAREAYRSRQIEELREEARALEARKEGIEEELRRLMNRQDVLEAEWARFPGGEDLRTAARDLGRAMEALDRLERLLRPAQEKLQRLGQQLIKTRAEAQQACQKCYLPVRLDVLAQAKEQLTAYKELLTKLQIEHAAYRAGIEQSQSLAQQAEELEADLDEIRYELGRLYSRLRELERALSSVREQLSMTNYEEIRERLDDCVRRLAQLPGEREASVSHSAKLSGRLEQLGRERKENEDRRLAADRRRQMYQGAFEEELGLGYVIIPSMASKNLQEQAERAYRELSSVCGSRKQSDLFGSVQEAYHQNRGYLLDYGLTLDSLFEDFKEEAGLQPSVKRLHIMAKYRGASLKFPELIEKLQADMEEKEKLLSDKDRELFEDILANTISKKIRARIHDSNLWVERMNGLMESMVTSSGLRLSLKWKSRRAEQEDQMDTRSLVALLQKDVEVMREEEAEALSRHFRSKIAQARKLASDSGQMQSFHGIMREVLDYRKWFEFQLEYQKTGEPKKELTDRAFFTFSGGEKAMSMYVPLFSAVVAKYAGAEKDAPRIISLDEAFAGVDEMNIKDMFRLMVDLEFNFIINSQVLWGDYETVPALAVYQLLRPGNAKYVTVIPYVWNGKVRTLAKETGAAVAGR